MRRHRLEGPRPTLDNCVELLVDGAQTLSAMFEAIQNATASILLESYILRSDATGRRFLDALVERARAGVKVRLIVDGIGSLGADASFFEPLVSAGGAFFVYRPPAPWRPKWGLWKRDHRKLLVVDERVAFIGGMNISDDYAPAEWGGRAWHDVHARVRGSAVRAIAKLFNKVWKQGTGEDWSQSLEAVAPCGDVPVQILESRFTRRFGIRRAYLRAIRRSRETIRITNAYFVPDRGVLRALKNAAKRGVRVQLLLAGQTDLKSVQYASRALYRSLLRAGVEIHEWTQQVLHAKCAVIDGIWCSIGSYNLDRRSLLHNLEANIVCLSPRLGADMDRQFLADGEKSTLIDPATWHRRSPVAKLLEQVFYKLRIFL